MPDPTRRVSVPVRKLDAEGRELGVREGARRLLQTALRPRGYSAQRIMQLIAQWNYRWFALSEKELALSRVAGR